MEEFVGLLYLLVAGHFIDASFNYARDQMMWSAVLNAFLSLVAVFVGVSLLV